MPDMGMFDSLCDSEDGEWQTKAFACHLVKYRIGDPLTADGVTDFQVEVLGGGPGTAAYATVRDGLLARVPDKRDARLPLIDYFGAPVEGGEPA